MADQLQDLILPFKTIGFKVGTAEVNQLTVALTKANAAAKGVTAGATKGAGAQRKLAMATNEAKGGFLGLGESLDHTIKKVAMWTLSTGAIFGTLRAFKAGIGIITEHDQAMINLIKVYSGAESDIAGLKEGIMDTARAMQSLHDAAFDAAITVARTGRTGIDLLRLTETALVAQNIAELESAKSVEYLNAALIQFNQTSDQAIRILDEWNELSNRTPAITDDLAQSISSAGSVFEQAGASIQFLNAATAALVEITAKSGNIVGRSLRTIAIYSQRINTVSKLAKIQVDVYDKLTDSYRGIDTILFEIAQKWDKLSDSQRANIAQTMAGARQQQFFLALMANQGLVLENLYIQWESFGSAMRENEKFLLSINKKVDGLINALERLSIGAGDAGVTGVIKALIDSLTGLVDAFNDANLQMNIVAAELGVLALILLPVSGTFTALAGAFAVFTTALYVLTNVTDTFNKKQRLMNEEMERTRLAMEKMSAESRVLKDMLQTVEALLAAGDEDRLYQTLEEINRITKEMFGEPVISSLDNYTKAIKELSRAAVNAEFALRMMGIRELEAMKRELRRQEMFRPKGPEEMGRLVAPPGREGLVPIHEMIEIPGKKTQERLAYERRNAELEAEIAKLRGEALKILETGKFPEPARRPLPPAGLTKAELRKLERDAEMFAKRMGNLMSSAMGDAMIGVLEGEGVNRALYNFTRRLGNMIGSEVSNNMIESMITAESTISDIIGAGLKGGLMGGLISAGASLLANILFPHERTEETRQTDAVEANTIQLQVLNENIRDLTTFFINAPAGFAVPAGAPSGGVGSSIMGGGGAAAPMQNIDQSLTIATGAIQVNQQPGQSGSDVAAQVRAQIIDQFAHGASVDSQY